MESKEELKHNEEHTPVEGAEEDKPLVKLVKKTVQYCQGNPHIFVQSTQRISEDLCVFCIFNL